MSRTMRWLVLACGLLLMAAPVFAATQNAVVYGTVYDTAGNPLAGATVTLDNPALGFTRTATTGSDGSYNFAEVPPAGGYRLTASKGDKKLDIRAGITVNVGDERVILPPLREQAVTASAAPVVEKTAEAQGVRNETVSTSISGVITGDQLRSLPSTLNRNFLSLGTLTPNTHDVPGGSELTGASFSVSGTRPATNDFLLDGSDNVASSSNQAVPFQVNDAIQEFRVTSSTASAEYGRNQGGVVNVVTRRGGNTFHGSTFGYFNNDSLNANNPLSVYNGTTFDKAAAYAGSPTPTCADGGFSPLTYNDYVNTACFNGFFTDGLGAGGTPANTLFDPAAVLAATNKFKQPFSSKQFGVNLGGALVKDKWFAFGSYEATLIDNPNQIFERVPSTFDRTFDPLGSGYTFSSGLGALDPDYRIAADTMALFPAANVIGVPDALEFYRGQAPNHTTVHNVLVRSDYVHSDKTTLTARYAVQWLNQLHDDTLPKQANYPGNGAFRDAFNQNLTFSYGRAFSPTLINEVRAGFNRFNVKETAQDASFSATTIGAAGFNLPNAALPTILLNGLDTQYSGAVGGVNNGAFAGWADPAPMAPTLDYFFPMARLGAPLSAPSQRRDTTWFVADSVSWSHGKHAVRFGAEFRHLENQVFSGVFSRGLIYSSNIGEFTTDSESCNICGDAFFRPSFDFAQAQSSPYVGNFRSYAVEGFLQDTWRFHPRWTLNAGIRYEYFSVPKESNDQIWNFDPAAHGLVQQGNTATVDPYGNACTPTPPTYQSFTLANQPAIAGVPGGWTCNPTGSGRIAQRDVNNFAPRLGLAWDVFGNGETVLRFGFGVFYDQLPISDVSQLLYNRPTSDTVNPNALQGRLAFDTAALCAFAGPSCGVGSSIVNPTVQAATTLDGVNPNSFYSSAAQPFAMYARDTANSSTPYTRQISASLQEQITNKLALEVGYIGTAGRKLPVVYNSNYRDEFSLLDPTVLGIAANATAGANVFFPVFTMTNQGQSSYHSLLLRARVAEFHGLRLNLNYNWSKSIDNASSGFFPTVPSTLNNFGLAYQRGGTENFAILCLLGTAPGACVGNPLVFPSIDFSTGAVTTTGANQVLTSRYLIAQDPFNFLVDDRGRSDFDAKHRFVLDYTWEIPGVKSSALRGNWAVSGVFVAQSGQPFTVFSGPILGEVTERANILGPVTQNNKNPSAAISSTNLGFPLADCIATVAPSAFIISPLQPTLGTACTGNSRRNQFTGPNFVNVNLAVQKGFQVFGEGRMLILRAEFYNLSNRANYYNPISTLSMDGVNPNPDFGKIKSAHDPRQVQLAVRFAW